ncbi:hypothetical protein [Psychrobacter sp. I-STPA6b]|uniref:hypothetical protein n=1 Tax=Psychrobacter sp. I-STPA6b TaxID=2585718 RepID=UPI001D0C077F|nr:hypothetical protein [Psychrobacter sp. I-STPA6b]
MEKGKLPKIMLLLVIICSVGIYWSHYRFVKLKDVNYSLSKNKYILSDLDKKKTFCYIKSLYQSKVKFLINENNEILIQNKEFIYPEKLELLWNYSSKAKEMANKTDQYGNYCTF